MGSIEEEQSIIEQALLQEELKLYAEDGSVDINGSPPLKEKTGNWKACSFILGNECCERLAYYGIAFNLITYLTAKLHQGNVSAARNVTTWTGTCYITSLIGAVLADAYLGRYWTIASFSLCYFIGLSALTLSASVPYLKPADCVGDFCPSPTAPQYLTFFIGLYLVALGTGGIKPCVSSFGADQFDEKDSSERVRKSSFFNWFYFCINIGAFGSIGLVLVQEKVGWGLGFGIPTLFMGLAIISFFFGTPRYRFQNPRGSPITRICQVLIASFRKMNLKVPEDTTLLYEEHDHRCSTLTEIRKIEHTDEYKYLDKAAVLSVEDAKSGEFYNPWNLCSVTQVEEVKILIRMFPIWASGIVFSSLYAQISTMFVQQGRAMNCNISSFEIPPAILAIFDCLSVLIWVPLYDQLIVPFARRFTGIDKGFTVLQRMGIGLFISVLGIASAAMVEIARLRLAETETAISITVFWQIPQYFILGAGEVFYFIGKLEFFYDQSPDSMRSLGSALGLLTFAFGSYLSSLILTVVTFITTMDGGDGWITDDLNDGHLDYFFWLMAGLSILNAVLYVFSAVNYRQKSVS